MIPAFTLTGTAEDVGARVAALAEAGVTEVAFQPGGPDVERELHSLAEAVAGARLP
jgi:5,10-methylenetetrahydromethanopterin reductase